MVNTHFQTILRLRLHRESHARDFLRSRSNQKVYLASSNKLLSLRFNLPTYLRFRELRRTDSFADDAQLMRGILATFESLLTHMSENKGKVIFLHRDGRETDFDFAMIYGQKQNIFMKMLRSIPVFIITVQFPPLVTLSLNRLQRNSPERDLSKIFEGATLSFQRFYRHMVQENGVVIFDDPAKGPQIWDKESFEGFLRKLKEPSNPG